MTSPNFKKSNSSVAGTTTKYGPVDPVYIFNVLDGTHASDRIQAQNIEHLNTPLFYDVVIYISGSSVIAKKASDGQVLSTGTNGTSNVPDVFQAAFNYYATVAPKPIIIVIRPGTYIFNGGTSAKILPFTTLWGYGATLKELVFGASMIRGDATGGALAAKREKINVLGLTFDFNFMGQEIFFPSDNTYGAPSDIMFKDCTFKNIKDSKAAPEGPGRTASARCLYVGGSSSVYNPAFNISFINNVCDAAIPGDTTGGEYAVFQMVATDGGKIIGNSISNAPLIKETAYYLYGYNKHITFAYNIGYNNDCQDLTCMQVEESTITGNVFSNRITSSNLKNVVISNNIMNRFRMSIYDKETFDVSTNISSLRSSSNVLVSGNQFDTSSTSTLGINTETVELEYSDYGDGTNPFKNIAIVGNQAKVYRKFVDLLRPQDNEVGPNQNIVISNNHCVEREINDTSFSPIVITGNTVVPSHGWKNVFFSGNYIGPLTTGAAGPYRDAAVTTTGMSNLVFRDNWFNGTGIDAVESYPYAAQNHGDATTRRYTNSGTANITSAATSVTVTHGVEYTPLAQDIYVTPTTSWGSATKFWVSTITATTFVINCTPAPGATMTFAWQVSRRS